MNHQFPMRSIFPPSVFRPSEFPSRPSRHQKAIDWGSNEEDDPDPNSVGVRHSLNPTTSPFANGQHALQAWEYPQPSVFPPLPLASMQVGASQHPEQQFYSRQTSHSTRNKETSSKSIHGSDGNYSRAYKSDTATAYAVKTARYPVLYEKIKAPATARKALKEWTKARGVAEIGDVGGVPTLEHGNHILIEGTRGGGNGGPSGTNSTVCHGADSSARSEEPIEESIRPGGTSVDSSTGRTHPDNGGLVQSVPSSNSAITRRAPPTSRLPPQTMVFSEPILEKAKRGNRIVVTCTLEKSYPNFHLECEYTYIDRSERINSSQTDTRFSFATITTRENTWIVAFEQRGYNEAFIETMVGQAAYAEFESSSGPVEGHPKDTGVAAGVGKKVNIPGEFDLGGIWCVADGFYKMKIFIPARTYRQDEWW